MILKCVCGVLVSSNTSGRETLTQVLDIQINYKLYCEVLKNIIERREGSFVLVCLCYRVRVCVGERVRERECDRRVESRVRE